MQSTATEVSAEATTSPETKFELKKVKDIKIINRKRDIVDARVRVLDDSIKTVGLQQPVVVTEDNVLVAGRHRLEVYIRNEWEEIPCIVKSYNDIDAELAEIDENLVRFELTDMERAMQYARRKELYEAKYPRTIEERKKLAEEIAAVSDEDAEDNPGIRDLSVPEKRDSFVRDTASKTGRSTSQVRDEARLGADILELSPEVRNLIAPTKVADNKSDLKLLIAETDEDVQLQAAQMVNDSWQADNNKHLSVREALSQLRGETTFEATVSEKGEATLNSALKKNLRVLELSVNSGTFKSTAESWTPEGIEDIREDLFRISELASKGAEVLSGILEAKSKIGNIND
jgi:ParB-like chromosome segregation protein Spo0J